MRISHKSKQIEKRPIWFDGQKIFVLRRAYQRYHRIRVKPSGQVLVTTSVGSSVRDIQKFIKLNQRWLSEKLEYFQVLKRQYPDKKFLQGEAFIYLGKALYLNFICQIDSETGKTSNAFKFNIEGQELRCHIPQREWNNSFFLLPQPQIKDSILKFYKNSGQKILKERMALLASEMGLNYETLSFRSQKTRWGSCSSTGHIILNWKLVLAPLQVIDYVLIHELSHLKFLNHSQDFWSLVKNYCPQYKVHRKWLNDKIFEFDFLAKESEIHLDKD
ncbi:MAG: M48 family metallopeptidase [Bdellovibrionales bacterium]|nr:M48 family metallopeptidase [Bdellovibrionales bacterium]